MDYDKNGNIKSLKRNGDFDSNIYGFMEIDDLVYDYDDNLKNQLVNVTDNTNDPKGFKDENNGTADYAYDANGNMTKDENKFISSIVYNHLNLPRPLGYVQPPTARICSTVDSADLHLKSACFKFKSIF